MAQGGVGDEREASGFALEVDGAPDGFNLLVNPTVRLKTDRPEFCGEGFWLVAEGDLQEVCLELTEIDFIQADQNTTFLPLDRIAEYVDRGISGILDLVFFFLEERMLSLSGEEEESLSIAKVLNAGDPLFLAPASLEFGNPNLILIQYFLIYVEGFYLLESGR